MRKLIAAFKVSLDMKYQGPGDYADWVPAWSEDYDLGDTIDACILGGAMYRGYEGYWSAMMAAPGAPSPMTGTMPTEDELVWARRIPALPHYVLTRGSTQPKWPNTRLLSQLDQVADLKEQDGKDLYLLGGGKMLQALMVMGLVDELRLIVYPIVAGGANDLFSSQAPRQSLEILKTAKLSAGRTRLDFAISGPAAQ